MAATQTLVVSESSERLDRYLSRQLGHLSRAQIQRLITSGHVRVNGRLAKPSLRLEPGNEVSLEMPSPTRIGLLAESIQISVLYEDEDVIVLDKPAGLVVHPAPGHSTGTLANALLAYTDELEPDAVTLRPGIVHRLDKDTSGVMVVAKSDRAHQSLTLQLQQHLVKKTYLALVRGRLVPPDGMIEGAIGRDLRDRKRMAVVSRGREARTRYHVLEYFTRWTSLEAYPETGRTHQIRVHFASIGHPVAGDPIYGVKFEGLGRQFLHARVLGFQLPSSGEYREFLAELPADLRQALDKLRKHTEAKANRVSPT